MLHYNSDKFQRDLHRGNVFEHGIGHGLARVTTGHYQSHLYVTGLGQPSGDGTLTVRGQNYFCEVKAEVNRYPNFCFETNGAWGRKSALSEAAEKGFLWVHYHGGRDVLIVARAAKLLPFLEDTVGQSGVQFVPAMGDGGRAAGYLGPIDLITGQAWVKTYPNFSGSNLTGAYALDFGGHNNPPGAAAG